MTAEEVEGDVAIITKGLSVGDRVVTEGQAQLKPNAKVSIQGAQPGKRQ